MRNLFDIPGKRSEEEFTEILFSSRHVRIERIVSQNHTTGWYDQDEDEWVCLLSGEAELEFEGETIFLHQGESIFLPQHKRHRVAKTTECIWLCVFISGEPEVQ